MRMFESYPKGPKTQIIRILEPQYYTINGIWAPKTLVVGSLDPEGYKHATTAGLLRFAWYSYSYIWRSQLPKKASFAKLAKISRKKKATSDTP